MRAIAVIPTYNERENIVSLINSILTLSPRFDVLVVDDSSPDGTGELVESIAENHDSVHILHRTGKLGYASAAIDGFRWALEHRAETIFSMDADFSHNPGDLPRLYDALKESDVVIGSRYVESGETANWPLRRQLLSSFANSYVRAITRIPIADVTSGFRGYNERVLRDIPLQDLSSKGYSFLVELTYRIVSRGFKIREVPIVFTDRRLGTSKMSKEIIMESIRLPWRLRFGK